MWMNIGTTLFIFAIGFTVYWAIKGRSEKFHKSKFGKIAIALFVLSIGAGMLDPSTNSSDGSSSTTQSQESHRSSSSTVKTPSVKKTKAESSSKRKAESSSENHVSKKAPSTKKTNPYSKYKPVTLASFAENPYKYDEKFISTTGTVIYIQKNPDDKNMYYVVIVPKDNYTTSGLSDGHGTVTEISIDTMKANSIHEGDTITVRGSGLTDTVTLNGKKIKSDIIVDYVKVH
ncbi:hypothetical protein [Lentilactobacillus parabuchneri]|uniref:hypothetical protein n=1 Tax=Lentilactobacillus parabuchneri TaxID=152331 RepID=UPI000A116CF3|nr:hypothetical protein FAM23164_02124 [Lentilactobacillus parabuchneri]ORN15369.1 hypothetical protein FAM23165_02164 [Lentilactobacillus parabuchneri]ORN18334.1 hypothetical protein FAM23166_02166 [Lentilactobacillus parabuchneri]ORN23967.1 hypothetical protein FAM23167_02089 [Lentilactobacillus parabuchneri]